MTYTFDPSLTDDVSYIRFEIGDTNLEGMYLQDETIQAVFDMSNDYGDAIVSCIQYIIAQLSQPNFSLDWLNVSDMAGAREGYEKLLAAKKVEYSIQRMVVTSTIALPYRADSNQDSSVSTYADDNNDVGSEE
jgi:hypothetical protein